MLAINELSPVHKSFEHQAERTPNAVAAIFDGQQISYGELNQQANQLAHYLIEIGVEADTLVGLCVERSLEMLVGMLAVLKAGGAYVPLDPSYPPKRLADLIEDSQVSVLITQKDVVKRLDIAINQPLFCFDQDWSSIIHYQTKNPNILISSENLAYIIYTSGSMGKPKGVMIPHRAMSNFVEAAEIEYRICKSDRVLQFASISFDAAVEEIYPCLIAGGTLILRTDEMIGSVSQFLKSCQDYGVTILDLPTAFWNHLTAEMISDNLSKLQLPDSVRLVIIGGEKASPDRVLQWQMKIGRTYPELINTYGPTEATVVSTLFRIPPWPSLKLGESEAKASSMYSVPIGKPLTNVTVYVLDEDLQPVPAGQEGELYLGGKGLARGYLNCPKLTAEKFIPDFFSQDSGAQLYKTGDLVSQLPDGNLEFHRRIDNQVKIRGFRIEVEEIENALLTHPEVQEVAVVASDDPTGYQRLVAYVNSSLIPARVTYKSDCILETEGKVFQLSTEDLSVGGLRLVGLEYPLKKGTVINLCLLIPGQNQEQWVKGALIWMQDKYAGIQLLLNPEEEQIIRYGIEYLLETQGVLQVLQLTLAKSLRNYLKKRLPNYMIPDYVMFLRALPLTSNGKIDRRYLSSFYKSKLEPGISNTLLHTPTEARLFKLWSNILGRKVSIYDNFFEVGGHSLLLAKLLLKLKIELGVEMTLRQFLETPTIVTQAHIIDQLLVGDIAEISERAELDLTTDAVLKPDIRPPKSQKIPVCIFLTGATGFLGSNLLIELLNQTQLPIACLVRAPNVEAGAQKLQDRLTSDGLWHESWRDRIIPIIGDLGKPSFGLSESQFNQLASTVEVIYHCGASVNYVYPYSSLKTSNVNGTEEILRLACHIRLKPVHYISTLSVFDSPEYFDGRTIRENDQAKIWKGLFSGYAQSKWVAEKIVWAAIDRGIPINIYRPGEIVGHSTTGAWNTEDYLFRLIKGCVQLNCWPDLDIVYQLTPVDYVSKVIVYLSQQASLIGKIFHPVNSQITYGHQIWEWLNSVGYQIPLASYQEWKTTLMARHQSQSHALSPLLYLFTENVSPEIGMSIQEMFVQGKSPIYDCKYTLAQLQKTSISCPPIDLENFNKYLSYFSDKGFLRPRTMIR